MRLPLLLAATLALAGPAAAQVIEFKPDATLACMEKEKRPGAAFLCVGEAARACIQKVKGASVSDSAVCLQSEAEYWKGRMDVAFKAMLAEAEKADAAFAKTPEAQQQKAKMTDDMAKEQAEWDRWSETRCWIEAGLRRGTPYRVTAAASCTMKQMAERALFYENALRYMQTK
ncbi:lysozyme inhibitor LprI family protein [Rhodovulum steppense]|uniref:Uncharacterized protein DUF1311 n=1 Tax=Rhodovulum steppense TaxID=540251 RepID=A0A4R1YMI6_9RHOB|nr:lysozyme inhibitor LprI family protein [Rhodovulum steppense]TCM78640.1 uncharacterized protein DUF1311 [Rhodovulum steppense]